MESLKNGISAIVIAYNEAERLGDCLKSLSWTQERIVIDNASSDNTSVIASTYDCTVLVSASKDFSVLRSIGLKHVGYAWILYLDADERVTPQLRNEIESITKKYKIGISPVAYYISRRNYYLGHIWPYQDKNLRLFYTSSMRGWIGKVHESAQVNGRTADLREPILHFTHRTLSEMVNKTNTWSDIEAELRMDKGHTKIVWWRFLRVMITGFCKSFFQQGGWKAGTIGWIESVYQAFSMFITYAKLWELQHKK